MSQTTQKHESPIIDTLQWAPSGNIFNASPGQMLRFLSKDGKTFGYAPSVGWSFGFGTPDGGDIEVNPMEWVAKHADGTFSVHPANPLG